MKSWVHRGAVHNEGLSDKHAKRHDDGNQDEREFYKVPKTFLLGRGLNFLFLVGRLSVFTEEKRSHIQIL